MIDFYKYRHDLESKNDLEWFDSICEFLKASNNPTTRQLEQIIGNEKPNPNNQIRGSKFLIPFDKRFVWACINPSLTANEKDLPIEYFAIGGKDFELSMSDLLKRFPVYRKKINIYDGGTQIFFHPISELFDFGAISFDIREEPEEIEDVTALVFHSVTFKFGDKLIEGRDGYGLMR